MLQQIQQGGIYAQATNGTENTLGGLIGIRNQELIDLIVMFLSPSDHGRYETDDPLLYLGLE
jgi:hypothetical protein